MSLFAFFGAPWEMIVVALVALLLFGNRLPSVMRSLGQSVTEFKKGMESPPEDDSLKSSEPAKKLDDQAVKS
jgi:sec-independent protein translocase protein TatA